MGVASRPLVQITCLCGKTATVTAHVTGSIESGGAVEISFTPDLPEGWVGYYGHGYQPPPMCSDCNLKENERAATLANTPKQKRTKKSK
jgi:hypothetical protein